MNIQNQYNNPAENSYHNDFWNKINPYIRKAWYSSMPPGDFIPERILYDYELILIKAGMATITIEDQIYEAKAGDIFLFKPGQRHSFIVHDETLIQPHIHFDLIYSSKDSSHVPVSFKLPDDMSNAEKKMIRPDLLGNFPNYIKLPNTLYVEQLMFDVINSYRSPFKLPELHLKQVFLRLLEYIISEINMYKPDRRLSRNKVADLVKEYLDHHTDCRITLDELSKVFHFNKSYISRTFNEAFNISPMRYHILLRIETAKNMLYYTNLSIATISEYCGFSISQDFSRTFSKITGTSPSEYRKNISVQGS